MSAIVLQVQSRESAITYQPCVDNEKGRCSGVSVCDSVLYIRLASWKHSSMQRFVVVLMALLICREAGKQSIFPLFYRLNRYNFAAAQNFGNGDIYLYDPSNDDYTNNVGVVQIVENGLRKYVCFRLVTVSTWRQPVPPADRWASRKL